MLAIGLQQAKFYSNKPCLLAKDQNDSAKDVYWVEDASLPCLSCKDNPLSLVSKKKMFALQKKYRVPTKVMKQIENFYKSDRETIDLKGDSSLGANILIQEIESTILGSLKRKYRDPNSQLLPYYDPELSGKIALHTSAIGPSSSGKSTIVSKILESNFQNGTTIWIFSPTATSDPVWKKLQKEVGRKKVKLVNTSKIVTPIDLETQIGRGSVIVFDDQDAVLPENERYTSALCSRAQYEGRHMTDRQQRGIVCFSIFHDGFSRRVKSLKSTNIESSRVILFPNQQRHVAKKVMKNRLGFSSLQIKEIFDFVQPKDRWIMLVQHCPSACITRTGVLLL
jgi:hypothetical protein|tara:strand:- start:225 stop:1238 length:1014 start_codon:yes stop_codon:yes gene_type:complete